MPLGSTKGLFGGCTKDGLPRGGKGAAVGAVFKPKLKAGAVSVGKAAVKYDEGGQADDDNAVQTSFDKPPQEDAPQSR